MPPDDSLRLVIPLIALAVLLLCLAIVAMWASLRSLRHKVEDHAKRLLALEEERRRELYPPHDRGSIL
jgi:predicted Holliday junction resolvase-like endonuclease